MSNANINKSIIIAASRETVWAFLTEKEKLGQWFLRPEKDFAQSEDYALFLHRDDGTSDKKCWGQILEMQRPDRLVYSFSVEPLNGAMTTVTWTLEDVGGATKLSLLHEGIGEAAGEAAMGLMLALDGGWDKHLATMRGALAEAEAA